MKQYILLLLLLTGLGGGAAAQQLIKSTLKEGSGNSVEVWLQPNFTNTSEYLFQIGLPIAFPASATPAPTSLQVTLHPDFIAAFGSNYTVSQLPVATATGGTEKYITIQLVRAGTGASAPQSWTTGIAFPVLSFTFLPTTAPAAQVKLADYQDGGSDGQGNFYTQSGGGGYYISSTSTDNFYATPGMSVVAGNAGAGYVQTNRAVPFVCTPPAPTVSNIGITTADISWTATGAGSYEYAVNTTATPPATGTSTSVTTYNASGLTANTAYFAHVRSNCGGGSFSMWSTTPFATQNPTCTAPAAAITTSVMATTATLTWEAAGGAAGYEYAFSTSATPPASGTLTTNLTATDNGLTAGTAYHLHLRTACAGGLFSSWVSTPFTTDCPGSATPTVSGITANGAMFSWPAVVGATGYQYDLTDSPTPPASGTPGAPLATNSHTATDLVAGSNYYFHLRTVCAAPNTFGPWVSSSFNTDCPGLAAPPVASDITATTATISWTAPPGIANFEYVQRTAPSPPTTAGTGAGTSVVLTDLIPGTTYYVFVRSDCSSGEFSDWKSVSFSTIGQSCPPPSPPNTTNITGTSALISWAVGTGVTQSQYVVSTNPVPLAIEATTIAGKTALATGLQVGTTYYAHVRTSCGTGNFSDWSTSSFNTLCGNPGTPTVTAITVNTTTLTLFPPLGATGYEYVLGTTNTPPVGATAGTPGTASPLELTGLIGGTRYYLFMRTICVGVDKHSEWVMASWVTPCAKPVITATVEAFTANMVWRAISGARRYEEALTTYNATPMTGAPTGDTLIQLPNLTEATAYYYHVRTYCMSGAYSGWTTVSFQTPGLSAYPNPVSNGRLRVNLYGVDAAARGELRLYDAIGRLVRVQTMTSGSTMLELHNLAAGMYLLKYSDGRVKYTTKVLKE